MMLISTIMFNGREYLVSNAKCLELDIPVPHLEMAEEAKALKEKFVPYRSSYKTSGWYSLPIIGKSSQEPYSWDNYSEYKSAKDAAADMHYTEIAEQCPTTINWLEKTYPSKNYGRVRFMLLEPGGYIEPHTDTTHSILGAINVALTHPEGCAWTWSDGGKINFQPGKAYAVNISYEHSVVNESDEDRYHLIVHHYDSTDEWKTLMTKALKESNEEGKFYFSTELF